LQVEAAIVHAHVTRMSGYGAAIVSPMSRCSSRLRQSRNAGCVAQGTPPRPARPLAAKMKTRLSNQKKPGFARPFALSMDAGVIQREDALRAFARA